MNWDSAERAVNTLMLPRWLTLDIDTKGQAITVDLLAGNTLISRAFISTDGRKLVTIPIPETTPANVTVSFSGPPARLFKDNLEFELRNSSTFSLTNQYLTGLADPTPTPPAKSSRLCKNCGGAFIYFADSPSDSDWCAQCRLVRKAMRLSPQSQPAPAQTSGRRTIHLDPK